MSKLNINKFEWLELVFEGKNKEYGAYQLRQEQGKTTAKAFISAIALLTGIAVLPMVLSSFTDKPVIKPDVVCPIDDSIHVTKVVFPRKESLKLPSTNKALELPKTRDLVNPIVVSADVAPDTNITTNNNLNQNNTTTGTSTGDGGAGGAGGSNSGGVIPVPDDNDGSDGNVVVAPFAVEKSPNFPGGIDAFLKIVGDRFRTPEVDEAATTLRVVVFFVVEKDGSLSNITVPRNPGFGLDKEAIRVLKSIKTKWEPGIVKGKPVRTQYSLPIAVKLQ